MNEDILILHALRDRRRFKQLRHSVPDSMLSPDTTNLLSWFALYFQTYPEDQRVEVDHMQALVKLRADPAAGADAIAITQNLVGKLAIEPSADAIRGIQNTLTDLALAGSAQALLSRFAAGEEVELAYEIRALANTTVKERQDGGVSAWANADISTYMENEADEGGLKLDMFGDLLVNTIRGLRPTDNVAVCAPTDAGKTSLLCAISSSFAKQRKAAYLTDRRPILYLVNEGTAERITVRMWQTVVGCSREHMYHMSNEGLLVPAYEDKIGGRDAIVIKNIHGKNLAQVEQIIEHFRPHALISDMTGRIRAVSNRSGAANDVSQLEEVWNGMRELAAIHDFLHMGTIQVSAEGFEMLYPPLSALQNSKTGIQTTLDMCLMMGRRTDLGNTRGISTPKNKLARSGCKSDNMFTTTFDPQMNTWVPPRIV